MIKRQVFLKHYVQHCTCIELNATHYNIYDKGGIIIHKHDEATSPELTVYLMDKMNAVTGLNLITSKFIEDSDKQKELLD